MLTPEEQVELLKAKGVAFERCDEAKAIEALSSRDTFLHVAAFRKMFQRHTDGDNAGKYVSLDFADLLDMDVLDAEVRRCFLLASQDVERIVKTRLIERISPTPGEDGYGILADFMQSQVKGYRVSIERNLKGRIGKHGSADEYAGGAHSALQRSDAYMGLLGGRAVRHPAGLLPLLRIAVGRPRDEDAPQHADGGEGGEELLFSRHMPHKRSGRGQVLRVRDAAPSDRVACGTRLQERQVKARQDGQPPDSAARDLPRCARRREDRCLGFDHRGACASRRVAERQGRALRLGKQLRVVPVVYRQGD